MKVSSKDLMHHRLQAWLRENTCEDIAYLGIKKDHTGEEKHFYRRFHMMLLNHLN